jgi:2-polyprenyl-6-methoxyphenol hydroxylase-like FAD-dependent oxidoreductase
MTARPLHVLIAGGGLSGLALAHGLLKNGHTVELYERDADLSNITRKQGYYLHMNPFGGEALRAVLPADLYELYLETSRETYPRKGSVVLNDQFQELSSQPHLGPPNVGDRPHTGVHRRTLRQILRARLDGALHFGVAITGYEEDADGVTATLSDGATVRGDVLVGADGIRSTVRSQRLPEVPLINTGVEGIGVYGRTPLTPELREILPPELMSGVVIAVDRKGTRLLVAAFDPRRPVDEAAREIAPDVVLDPMPAYLMVSCSTARDTVVPPAAEWTAETPALMRESMLRAVEGWHPVATTIVGGMALDTIFMIPFGFILPAETWESSRVTLVGDAAHAMLPTLGMGANLALRDAQVLVEQLGRAARGEADLVEAIGEYERDMRDVVYPFHRMTINHDENFGGGALASSGVDEGADEGADEGSTAGADADAG